MTNRRLFRSVVGVLLIAVSAGCVPKAGTDGVKDAGKESCLAERNIVENAVEAFYALNGANPSTEAELVPMFLRTESVTMDLDPAGNVVAAPGSNCL